MAGSSFSPLMSMHDTPALPEGLRTGSGGDIQIEFEKKGTVELRCPILKMNPILRQQTNLAAYKFLIEFGVTAFSHSDEFLLALQTATLYLIYPEKIAFYANLLQQLLCNDVHFNKVTVVTAMVNYCPEILDTCDSIQQMLPIHYAVVRPCGSNEVCEEEELSEQTQLIKLILKNRPECASAANTYGETPLHLLCNHPNPSKTSIGILLLAAPGCTSMQTNSGKLPIHLLLTPSPRRREPIDSTVVLMVLSPNPQTIVSECEEEQITFSFDMATNNATQTRCKKKWNPMSRIEEQGHYQLACAIMSMLNRYAVFSRSVQKRSGVHQR